MNPGKPHILLIGLTDKDSADTNSLIQLMLERGGCVVTVVECELALDSIEREPYDLAIFSTTMFPRGGVGLAQTMKLIRMKCPVMLVTARAMTPDVLQSLELDPRDCFPKPFVEKDFLGRIRAKLDHKFPELQSGRKRGAPGAVPNEGVLASSNQPARSAPSDSKKASFSDAAIGAFVVSLYGFVLLANLLGGLVGGLVSSAWLLFIGQWRLILLGVALTIAMPTYYFIVTLPATLLGLGALKVREKSRIGALLMLSATSLYNLAAVQFWIVCVLTIAAARVKMGVSMLPMTLWAYSVALSPLAYMSRGDEQSFGTQIGLLAAQMTMLLGLLLWWVGVPGLVGWIAILITLVAAMLQVYAINLELKTTGIHSR